MELKAWKIEKPRLLTALGKMEAWTVTLLQSVQESRQMVEKANDDFMFQPESHPIGLPEFEMAMRGIDSSLREILAIHQAIQDYYRENSLPLNTGRLFEKPDFTPDEITEVLELVQSLTAKGNGSSDTPIVCQISKDNIELQIEENK